MYKKLSGIALLGVFAVMLIPGNLGAESVDEKFYGAATFVKNDASGNEVFSQTVHNAITDEGEDFLIDAVFADGNAGPADNVSIGTICISDSTVGGEADDDTNFDADSGLTETACEEAAENATTTASVATIGPLQFTCGGTNCADDDTILGIGICANLAGNDSRSTCGNTLFAHVNVTSTTLATGETVDITYTFDISSDNS